MDGQWTEADAALVANARDLEWQQGDRLRHAISVETKRGSAKAEAAIATRRDLSELTMMVRVCEAFSDTRRRYDLTFAHHAAVLKLNTDAERDDVLVRAAAAGWSARQTARAVLEERVRSGAYQPPVDDDPDDTEMRQMAQAWNRGSSIAREDFLELAIAAKLGEIDL